MTPIHWAVLVLFSVLLPTALFFGRGSIRHRRLQYLEIIEKKILNSSSDRNLTLLPMLELLKGRYEVPIYAEDANLDIKFEHRRAHRSVRIHAIGYLMTFLKYSPAVMIFVTLSSIGFYLLFVALSYPFTEPNLFTLGLKYKNNNFSTVGEYQATTALVVAVGFLGAYIWSINYLILRVANFDLTPLDFLRTGCQIIMTVLIAGVFRHLVASASDDDVAESIVMLAAFLFGLFPGLGIATLIDRLPASFKLKRLDPNSTRISRELPLDMIDGIDGPIKFRLGNYEINDIQTLATQQPIGIFISTPYRLLQIIDWVAQAQLILEIGTENYLKARHVTVRDIRAFVALGGTVEGRAILAPMLFGGRVVAASTASPPAEGTISDGAVQKKIEGIALQPHVRNLLALSAVFSSDGQDRAAAPHSECKGMTGQSPPPTTVRPARLVKQDRRVSVSA